MSMSHARGNGVYKEHASVQKTCRLTGYTMVLTSISNHNTAFIYSFKPNQPPLHKRYKAQMTIENQCFTKMFSSAKSFAATSQTPKQQQP